MRLFTQFILTLPRLLPCHLRMEMLKSFQVLPNYFVLPGDVSLNPGPTPSSVFQSFWKRFENKGLQLFHSIVHSIL